MKKYNTADIPEAVREVRFWIDQGNSIRLALDLTCAMRNWGAWYRARLARAISKT